MKLALLPRNSLVYAVLFVVIFGLLSTQALKATARPSDQPAPLEASCTAPSVTIEQMRIVSGFMYLDFNNASTDTVYLTGFTLDWDELYARLYIVMVEDFTIWMPDSAQAGESPVTVDSASPVWKTPVPIPTGWNAVWFLFDDSRAIQSPSGALTFSCSPDGDGNVVIAFGTDGPIPTALPPANPPSDRTAGETP
jgi:hypothetical protein